MPAQGGLALTEAVENPYHITYRPCHMVDGPLPGTDSGVTARHRWLLRPGPAPTPVFCDPVTCDPVLCDDSPGHSGNQRTAGIERPD